jgi:hypothetical protein
VCSKIVLIENLDHAHFLWCRDIITRACDLGTSYSQSASEAAEVRNSERERTNERTNEITKKVTKNWKLIVSTGCSMLVGT